MNSPFPQSSSVDGKGRIVVRLLPKGISGLEVFEFQYPLKLVTPKHPPPTSALVYLLSYGGGLVGGDKVNLTIHVQTGARLSLATQGHTKIFKSARPDIVTRQTMHVDIDTGGAVCLLPDPVQPFARSVYEQTQIFKLARNASLCLLDWVIEGRSALGEHWSFVKWVGRNEVWAAAAAAAGSSSGQSPAATGTGGAQDRLLVRDVAILDGQKAHPQLPGLRESMNELTLFGTLILRGPLMKAVGEFFLAEFAVLPRLGARDWRSDDAQRSDESDALLSPRERWRKGRLQKEKDDKVLWSAASVRGCVVVKFGAPTFEAGRLWLGSMLAEEGSISKNFGEQALMCLRW